MESLATMKNKSTVPLSFNLSAQTASIWRAKKRVTFSTTIACDQVIKSEQLNLINL